MWSKSSLAVQKRSIAEDPYLQDVLEFLVTKLSNPYDDTPMIK